MIPNGSISRLGWQTDLRYCIDTVPVVAAYDNTGVASWGRAGFDTIINDNDSEIV